MSVGVANVSGGDDAAQFAKGFGGVVQHEQTYKDYNPWIAHEKNDANASWDKDIQDELMQMWDERRKFVASNKAEMKRADGTVDYAMTSGNMGTLPIYVDTRMPDLAMKKLIMVPMLRRVAHAYSTIKWDPVTVLGAADTDAEGGATVLASDADDTVQKQSVDMKFIYSKASYTGVAKALQAGYAQDRIPIQMSRRVQAMNEKLEQMILTGDGTGNDFKGCGTLFTSNTVDGLGAAITEDMIRELERQISQNGGSPVIGITDTYNLKTIRGFVDESVRSAFTGLQGFGGSWLEGVMFDDMMILGSRFMPVTTGSRKLFLLTPEELELRNLLPMTNEPLAQTVDIYPTMFKEYVGLMDWSANAVAGDGSGGQHHGQITDLL